MSVFVRVRQFFNQEGLQAFSPLFEEHRRLAASFPGFISLQRAERPEAQPNGEIEIILAFENQALLGRWRSSPQHEQIAAAYARYWMRDPEIVFASAG